MNFRTTLILLIIAAALGAYVWVYERGAKAFYLRSTRFGWTHLADHPGTDFSRASNSAINSE